MSLSRFGKADRESKGDDRDSLPSIPGISIGEAAEDEEEIVDGREDRGRKDGGEWCRHS